MVELFDQLTMKVETSRLNKAVQDWVETSPPPASPKAHFKVRYAVQTGTNPVSFAFFATRPDLVGDAYRSYLKNRIRSDLGYKNVPVELELRASRKRFEDLEKN